MISLLVCSRISGNKNSALLDFLENLEEMTASYKNFELLIKFDSDDKEVEKVLPKLDTYPFRVKYIIEPRDRGYIDLHKFYNRLLPLIDERSLVIGAMADDFKIIQKGWDEIILSKIGTFEDGIFIIHGRPHPPSSRNNYQEQKFYLDFDINNLENLAIIDEAPLWSRKLLDICRGFGHVSFTDAWTLTLEYFLFHEHKVNRTIFLEQPIIFRKLRDDIDQAIAVRWWTDRANNFAFMRTDSYKTLVKRQALNIYSNIKMSPSQKKISIILTDWSVRESFHSIACLNRQTIPRDQYEVIWVEYYNARPKRRQEYVEKGNIDKWLVLNQTGMHQKHLLYNEGIVAATGEIIAIPDSDALFSPSFVESIVSTFNQHKDENIVLYLDELRSCNTSFSPLDVTKASWEDIMQAPGITNWDSGANKPLSLTSTEDILHRRNYGACFCATRKSIIEAGGVDDHIAYHSLWCGAFELGFRLVNRGYKEIWHENEWLLHVWHPGTEGECKYIEWKPGMAPGEATVETDQTRQHDSINILALEILANGRTEPLVVNPKIKELREQLSQVSLSIVFITYRPGGIDILADSLGNQTMKDYELIVVDDYPADRKDAVKRYLQSKGIPVTYVGPSKPKCFPEVPFNVFNAMNTGLLLSTKEVVVILQDYQWLPPDCLEKFARHYALFKDNYCVVLPGQMWEHPRPRDDEGLISIWSQPWKGRPEDNGCQKSFAWVPEAWEFACTAYPWSVVAKMNGFPECLDAFASHPLEPVVKRLEAAGGKPYVDKDNFIQMINHRDWLPHELWHQAKRAGSTEHIERENCFDLKAHTRGKAYWLEARSIFDKPEYWCGEMGYRPGPDGIGYKDFPIHEIKTDYILSRKPGGKVLDIGCAYGYIVRRLRDKGVDAWGVDVSKYALSQAPDEVKPYLKQASADSLAFIKDKEFDLAVSFSTFEHLSPTTLNQAISEAVRVAKRGIIAVTPGDDPHFDEDITHQTKLPLSWWREQFPAEFEIRNDADEEWLKKIPEVYLHRHEWIRSKASLGDRILEVGCAENPVWAGTKFNVVTFDNQINPKIKIFPDVKGEAENLPFEDNSFDIVCEGELLEHIPDPQRVLKEAVRVAKKKVIITVPYEHVWPSELKPFWNPGHVRFYTPDTLRDELEKAGLPFKIEEIRHNDWVWLGAEVYCNEGKLMSSEILKINLGSFVDTIGHGWENWDILPIQQRITSGHKFKQWDVRRGLPLPDNSVDLIRMSHLIEHLTLEEAHNLFSEIYRILKPRGLARISTPDAHIIIKRYFNRDMSYFNWIQPPEYIAAPTEGEKLSRLLFSGDYSHKAIYDFPMLRNFLEQAGFEKIYQVSPGFSYSEVIKTETEDQHIEVSLTVEAVK